MCAAAIADCFAHDGEILANPIGTLPVIGGRLAKATVAPELVMTDGEALLVENILPLGVDDPEKVVAGWNPYRTMFDVVWSGRRHVMMSGSQLDKFGNQNFAFIGSHAAPRTQLLGMRGAPGNTINDKTSYWIPGHTTRTFVPAVDVVSGVGYDRAADLGPGRRTVPRSRSRRHQSLRARLRNARPPHAPAFGPSGRDGRRRRRRHRVRARDRRRRSRVSRLPTDDELEWIRVRIDPTGLGEQEVPNP